MCAKTVKRALLLKGTCMSGLFTKGDILCSPCGDILGNMTCLKQSKERAVKEITRVMTNLCNDPLCHSRIICCNQMFPKGNIIHPLAACSSIQAIKTGDISKKCLTCRHRIIAGGTITRVAPFTPAGDLGRFIPTSVIMSYPDSYPLDNYPRITTTRTITPGQLPL